MSPHKSKATHAIERLAEDLPVGGEASSAVGKLMAVLIGPMPEPVDCLHDHVG